MSWALMRWWHAKLGFETTRAPHTMGRCRAKGYEEHHRTVRVGIVAKYLDNEDTYMSVIEALKSAAWHTGVSLQYSG